MSISKEYNVIKLNCDYCFKEVNQDFESFGEAVEYKNAHGWKSNHDRIKNQWFEICPECQKKDKEV